SSPFPGVDDNSNSNGATLPPCTSYVSTASGAHPALPRASRARSSSDIFFCPCQFLLQTSDLLIQMRNLDLRSLCRATTIVTGKYIFRMELQMILPFCDLSRMDLKLCDNVAGWTIISQCRQSDVCFEFSCKLTMFWHSLFLSFLSNLHFIEWPRKRGNAQDGIG